MPTRALFIIDPPERLDPPTDTTLAIMRESRRRSQQVSYTTLDGLRLTAGGLHATAREVDFSTAELFTAGPARDLDLDKDCDLVWMRKDPPVDLPYLHSTYLLDFLPPRVLQINPARVLREVCEKLAPLRFPELFPPSLVSRSPADLATFVARQGRAVLKPLEECSGRGIVLVDAGMPDLAATIARATENGRRFVQGQLYLGDISSGDIRVLLLGGEILGWVRRLPAPGEFRSNVNAGGHCEPCALGPREKAICARVGPWLRDQGIHFAGIDIVGDYLLEINLTSPSCLREMNSLNGWRLEEAVLDYVETRLGP
jgi:glutathione synthase